MKRKFSDKANWRRILRKSYKCIKVDEPDFRGLVTFYRIHEISEPMWRVYAGKRMCLADAGYLWMQHFPQGERFVVTTMFDDKSRVIQWYIDVCKTQGVTDQDVPWFDDLYLDVIVRPTGEVMLVDEDELEEALSQHKISRRDAENAKRTAAYIMRLIKQGKFPYFDLSRKYLRLLESAGG
jgi:predicted RNA-binding protein associated with RNAse of E/G family